MRNSMRVLGLTALFFTSSLIVSAHVAANPDAPTTPQPFTFYCEPYTTPFTEGGEYMPTNNGTCFYTLPQQAPGRVLSIYKGVVGNAVLIQQDLAVGTDATSLRTVPNSFGSNAQGDNFFTAAYGVSSNSEIVSGDNYLTTGVEPAPGDLTTLQWKWGAPVVPGDTTPPNISITVPSNGASIVQNEVVFVSATITDDVEVATSTYSLNGTLIDGMLALPLMSQPLGAATLVVSATDTSGNVGYATSTFTITSPDLTAPSVTITSPAQGSIHFDTATVFLTATISDVSDIVAESYTFNGASIDPLQPLPLLTAPLGSASVSVSATDAYGNAASSTVTFTIKSSDITPPSITITSPVEAQSYLNSVELFAAATITDASGIASSLYELNGNIINPVDPLPLTSQPAGSATLVVTATDNFGNAASSSVVFTIIAPPPPDTEGPVVVITNPKNNKLYKRNEKVKPAATITDESEIVSVKYIFNDKEVVPTQYLPFYKTRMGTSTLSVIAIDEFGNEGSSTIKFRIGPGLGTCITDIIEAFDKKWIKDKSVFTNSFKICHELFKFDKDKKDKDYNDDDYHGNDDDDRADKESNKRYDDLHKFFSWDRKDKDHD